MPKNSKEAIQAHSTFLETENFKKNARGYPLVKFEKKSHSAEKTQMGPLWSRLYFWKHKKICGLMQESNPRSTASQKISRTNEQKIVKKWTIQSEIAS